MQQSMLAAIEATQRLPTRESSFLWGLVGLGVTALSLVVKPPPVFEAFLLLVAWVCFSGSCWIAFRGYELKRRRLGTALLSLLIGTLIVVMWAYTGGEPVAQLSVENEEDPRSFVPQNNQVVPPQVHTFARIKVVAEGGSVTNVRIFVSKINDGEEHIQLYRSSEDTLFKSSQSSQVEESVDLNSGDEEYFDALVECNGTSCPDGVLAIPYVKDGKRRFGVIGEYNAGLEPRTLTIRATGDGVSPVTRTFTVLLEKKREGKLLLIPKPDEEQGK